jgi:multiple sugar transport system permease protein
MITSLMMILPLLWMLNLSFRSSEDTFGLSTAGENGFDLVDNYARALTAAPFARFLLNGVLVCASIVALQVILCAPFAYALAKHKFRGRNTLLVITLLALIVPHQVLTIPLFIMARYAGLLNTFPALIIPYAVSPLGIFLLRQAFVSVPDDVVYAARLDGLSEWAIVWRVMLPMVAPSLAAFGMLITVTHWNDLLWPLIVLRSEDLMPPALGVATFHDEAAGSDYGVLMAAATLVVAPLILIFLWAQRWLIDALTAGSVK